MLNQHTKRIRSGFTLVELLITFAIIGILASVAYPSYVSQVQKGRRADAMQGLAQVLQTQERWRSNNPSYASNSLLTTPWPDGLGLSSTTTGSYYTLTIGDEPSGTAYTVSAVARASQAGDTGCTTLTVTIDKGTVTNTPASCWAQ
jgi:type IV pilus assembly protein PilE